MGVVEHNFRSKFEEQIWNSAKKRKVKLDYEPKTPRIEYLIPYWYLPDFRLANGIYIEAKGYLRPRDRTKMRKVKECNPDLDIRFVFMKASNKIGKGKNSETYGEWADRLGFKWAEKDIPEEWINELRRPA